MSEIDDPWHSRPIDVHRWSEHPEVEALTERVWGEVLPEEIPSKSGPKPKLSFKKQLRVLLLDLYVAWLEDPELSIGVSMSVNTWKTNSRYNALFLSKKIVDLIRVLQETGFLDMAKGSYGGPTARGNRTTRIRASEKLQTWFKAARFSFQDVGRAYGEEVIILKDENSQLVEYTDTPDTIRMREELRAYNELICSTFVDIPSLEVPLITLKDDDLSHNLRIDGQSCRTRRIFSRKSWEMNGRFYGGWWQRISSEWRSKIFIDNEPTVEVDFQGLHIALLYSLEGLSLTHDPYDLSDYSFSMFPPVLLRKLVKRLALTAINAKGKAEGYNAFRSSFPSEHAGRQMTNSLLDKMLSAFLERSPCLESYLFTDQGIKLMRLDGDITEIIHRHFTEKRIPVLSVHDSYIIPVDHIKEMREAMSVASETVVGRSLASSVKLPGRADFEYVSDDQLWTHIQNLHGPVSKGYIKRMMGHEQQTGSIVSAL